MAAPTLLITGAAGFTGRHLLAAAGARGYRCIALCHAGQRLPDDLAADGVISADLTDARSLRQALDAHSFTHAIHLGAVSFVAHDDVSEIYRSNVLGSVNLAQVLSERADLTRLLVASSANVYGPCRDLPITEQTPVRPVNHYAVSKLSMEQALACFEDLRTVIVRPFNYTGAGQSERFLVAKLAAAFRRRDPQLTLGNLDIARDFSDVRDVCRAYLDLLEHPSPEPLYNLCSGEAESLKHIVETLAELSGHRPQLVSDPALMRANDIRVLSGDPGRLRATIGTYPRYTLRETLDWMLQGDAG